MPDTVQGRMLDTSLTASVGALAKDAMKSFGISIRLTERQLEDVKSGKEFLVIYGTAKYEDVFAVSRGTRFCYVYNPRIDDLVGCTGHNDSD
jgi:hypothetical protein